LLARAFAFPAADALPWLEKSGREQVRVLRENRRVIACLLMIPMGQYFGGRSVPTIGVAGVAVAPEDPGPGVPATILSRMLRGMRKRGPALSTLYPATQALYRKVGYEQGGTRFEIQAPAHALRFVQPASRARIRVRKMEEPDMESIRSTYRTVASRSDGHL